MASPTKPSLQMNYWRTEVEPRLQTLLLYQEFCRRGETDRYFDQMNGVLIEALYYAHQRAKMIVHTLPEYTLHDCDHLFRVVEIMGRLLTREQIKSISIVDIYSLIICAFFHDLGLAPTKREIESWRVQLHSEFVPKHSAPESIATFISARPAQREELKQLEKLRDTNLVLRLENKLITQFIRETHGIRLKEIFDDEFHERFKYRDLDLTPYISMICQSHVLDALNLSKLENLVPCGDEILFSPPFVGVILRLADLLDFDAKRAPVTLFDAMGVEDGVSILEWTKHRSVGAWVITPTLLQIRADCVHPIIEEAIKEFCGLIDEELLKCSSVLATLSDRAMPVPRCYKEQLPSHVDRTRIAPKRSPGGDALYTYSKTRFTLDQEKVVDLLMGTSLYGNPTVALRELLQNSIDACLVRAAFERAWKRTYQPAIHVHFDRSGSKHTLTITDNGIGMDEDIVHNYYAKVGSCYYRSEKFYRSLAENQVSFTSISRFGIGVLSYFLVASRVLVATRRLVGINALATPLIVKVDGVNGLFWIAQGKQIDAGTETTLDLMPQHPWKDYSGHDLMRELRKLLPEPPFEIEINVDGQVVRYREGEKIGEIEPDAPTKYPDISAKVRLESIAAIDRKNGYHLEAEIGWLEQNGVPLTSFVSMETTAQIKGNPKPFSIKNTIESRVNRITRWSTSFEFADGKFRTNSSYLDFLKSDLDLSLHGFHVPFDPFHKPKSDSPRLLCTLAFPFFIHGALSVRSPGDLNLNAARDNVIPDNKWFGLRNWMVRSILHELKGRLEKNNYVELLTLWKSKTEDTWTKQIIDNFKQI